MRYIRHLGHRLVKMAQATLTRVDSGYRSLNQTSTPEEDKMPVEAPDYPGPSNERVTPFLIYLLFFATLGPLQFGYHLVSMSFHMGDS